MRGMAISKCNKIINPSSTTRGLNGLSIDGRMYFDDVWHDLNFGEIKCNLPKGHRGRHEARNVKKNVVFKLIYWSD